MVFWFIYKILGQYINIIGYYFVKDYCINQSPEMSSYYNCLSVYYLVCSPCSLENAAFKHWCSRVNRLRHISFFFWSQHKYYALRCSTGPAIYLSMTPSPILMGLYLLEWDIFGSRRSFEVSWDFFFFLRDDNQLN